MVTSTVTSTVKRMARTWMISLAGALVVASPGAAIDGVLEINQACAENTGCFTGDIAGFPVVVGDGAPASARDRGNYVLTSDLVIPTNRDAIFIAGENVNLDMNGFSILCDASSNSGIVFDIPHRNSRIFNGRIVGCPDGGLQTGDGARIERMVIEASPAAGIVVGQNSVVEDCIVIDSASGVGPVFSGISLGENSIARGNVVSGAIIGIDARAGGLLTGNVTRNNTDGLSGSSSTFSNNTSVDNLDDGIAAGGGSSVIDNTLRNNGFGLDLGSDTTYRGNTITGSTSGPIQNGTGVNKGDNHCSGTATISANCP